MITFTCSKNVTLREPNAPFGAAETRFQGLELHSPLAPIVKKGGLLARQEK